MNHGVAAGAVSGRPAGLNWTVQRAAAAKLEICATPLRREGMSPVVLA